MNWFSSTVIKIIIYTIFSKTCHSSETTAAIGYKVLLNQLQEPIMVFLK